MNKPFTGDQKKLDNFLLMLDKKIISLTQPLIPPWITTVQLTLMTVGWSLLMILFGYLADFDIRWLWCFSLCIFLQHVTDMLDGAVGRARNEGYVKWGFYVDHLLDYFFLCSVVIGYSFLLPLSYMLLVLLCITISGGIMVHFFLDFSVTSEFKVSFNRFGASEIRYVLIFFNITLIFLGKQFLVSIFPLVVVIAFCALLTVVYKSQKIYAEWDMEKLKNDEQSSSNPNDDK